MTAAGDVLLEYFGQAWTLIAGLLVLIAMLGGLAQVLKMAGGMLLRSNFWVAEAMAGILGVILIALVGFLSIPAIVRALRTIGGNNRLRSHCRNWSIGCDAHWRHWFTADVEWIFIAVASASIGGSGGVSNALTEIAETIFGMLLITVAAPVAAAFFGAC